MVQVKTIILLGFIFLSNTLYSQVYCCDSLKKAMYYGKILVRNIEYRDSLLNIRAKIIGLLEDKNSLLLDSIKSSNNIITKLNSVISDKENTILYQEKKIKNIRKKNFILIVVIIGLTLIAL